MKVFACLIWYEESPSWLAALVASCRGLADHVVAVDGPYFLYPGALERPRSGAEQADAIQQAAHACGMGCTIHTPAAPWAGNEVEKRTFLMRLGAHLGSPEDWLFIVDADDIVTHIPPDARSLLAESEYDVAEATLWWREDWEAYPQKAQAALRTPGGLPDVSQEVIRKLFRALPSLRAAGAHHAYAVDYEGRTAFLRGHRESPPLPLEPALPLLGLRVEHRTAWRNPARRAEQASYYALRNSLGVEAPPPEVATVADSTTRGSGRD